MSSIHKKHYRQLIEKLKSIRESKNLTQSDVANLLIKPQSYIAKVETCERRLDIIELMEWLTVLDFSVEDFFSHQKIVRHNFKPMQALPVKGEFKETNEGVLISMYWGDGVEKVILENVTPRQYSVTEDSLSAIFNDLNNDKIQKNRDAILKAFETAFNQMPNANPSDVFQHVVYRIYLRDYQKSNPEQSWRRASGEALELFVANRYAPELEKAGIKITALISGKEKAKALEDMRLNGKVGDSKLDIVLHGRIKNEWKIFGGIHCKASLAERISDDVPCSEAMMREGLLSILYTFDSKSFPPPTGNLVNRGELGSPNTPSDKRKYIEEHGSFDACFSYNLRTVPSLDNTKSGKKIFVGSFKPGDDYLPRFIIEKWEAFKRIHY